MHDGMACVGLFAQKVLNDITQLAVVAQVAPRA